jgi:hypothetical protein
MQGCRVGRGTGLTGTGLPSGQGYRVAGWARVQGCRVQVDWYRVAGYAILKITKKPGFNPPRRFFVP